MNQNRNCSSKFSQTQIEFNFHYLKRTTNGKIKEAKGYGKAKGWKKSSR
jgi:hypothetical protein